MYGNDFVENDGKISWNFIINPGSNQICAIYLVSPHFPCWLLLDMVTGWPAMQYLDERINIRPTIASPCPAPWVQETWCRPGGPGTPQHVLPLNTIQLQPVGDILNMLLSDAIIRANLQPGPGSFLHRYSTPLCLDCMWVGCAVRPNVNILLCTVIVRISREDPRMLSSDTVTLALNTVSIVSIVSPSPLLSHSAGPSFPWKWKWWNI